jgi:hypothetical protein
MAGLVFSGSKEEEVILAGVNPLAYTNNNADVNPLASTSLVSLMRSWYCMNKSVVSISIVLFSMAPFRCGV